MHSMLEEELWNARFECRRCAALHFNDDVLADSDLSGRWSATPDPFLNPDPCSRIPALSSVPEFSCALTYYIWMLAMAIPK